ncbi:epimerase [Leucobacter iarius]|uniref:TIGR01777 family oxidoreductase n=1 Tax=Leucobacter iarius TaxID=333963 RepID=A0ABP4XRD8_9MICO
MTTGSSESPAQPTGRVVVGGAGGFMGGVLVQRLRESGRQVLTVGRRGADLRWDDDAGLARAVDGASLVLGLAGKSVNCRYTPANRAEILRSRVGTTAALGRAIRAADAPPPLWINASTATIYRHAEDRPMTERAGELGEGFSVGIARAWEREFFSGELPGTRRVALRTAIVLGHGGVLGPIGALARLGLGGAQWDGRWPIPASRRRAGTAHRFGARWGAQRFSWIHVEDVARIVGFIESRPELDGPINVASPNPSTNRELQATVRRVLGIPFGVPMPRWMLEIGAAAIRTETELVLKSRWVLPERLQEAGFRFAYPQLEPALRESFA